MVIKGSCCTGLNQGMLLTVLLQNLSLLKSLLTLQEAGVGDTTN